MIKYLIMDVDGTLTDGKIYMGPNGEAMKAFSVKDGYVFKHILEPAGIHPIILTARKSNIVQLRCEELGIKDIYQGKLDKLNALIEIVGEKQLGNCAYFGDDILDLKCMIPIKTAGGIVGCPSDAVDEVRAFSGYICTHKAGDGALREFSEWLVRPRIDEEKINKRVQFALSFLQRLRICDIENNKNIVVNDFFSYSVQNYFTKNKKTCQLVSHKEYINIQIIVAGNEMIDLVDVLRLTELEDYDKNNDVAHWNCPKTMLRVKLSMGDYIIIYPENAYRDGVCLGESERVIKIIGKIRIR